MCILLKKSNHSPVQVVQLVRVSSQYAKVVGLIPDQGTYMQESINECMTRWNNILISFFLSPSSSLFLKINKIFVLK